ncbi:hypothetical protein KUW14_04820 [Pseudooceanicola nitratireducens]|uniref:hypothetical protein n=1 Tax=Pseudooceanicola nitratireducens TaxID=517719 RepID=UPI001C98B8D1|nr:hypothetical protein [Pseudooceanicola nitratireducens]MBY6165166.1 hypothetical protein [Pseudooceanicola nitratireducens]
MTSPGTAGTTGRVSALKHRINGHVARSVLARLVLILSCLLILPHPATAQSPRTAMPKSLIVDVQIRDDGIRLIWPTAKPRFVGNVEISRRPLGATGLDSWEVIAPQAGTVMAYLDAGAAAGTPWEYRVRRIGREVVDQGYVAAGIDLPAIEDRGTALMIVDDTIAEPLAPELERFRNDLIGDGWQVTRIDAPSMRDITKNPAQVRQRADALKSQIIRARIDHTTGDFTIILIGNLPLLRSGQIAPDGHQARAFGTDLYYADIGGRWPVKPDGDLLPSILPDGKIEMSIGRIDFHNVGPEGSVPEIEMLRRYFDRNHAWRHGLWGDLRRAYAGARGHLMVEAAGLTNIVGAQSLDARGHNETTDPQRWLFGVDFGKAQSKAYFEQPVEAPVFAMNFGSHKLAIDRPGNQMAAMLAHPNQTLAVAWGARPAWRLHGMAVGETIGRAQLRTVNNGPRPGEGIESIDYLPTGPYLFVYPIWGNLLGDPTLHAFPVMPPSDLARRDTDQGAQLTWTVSREPGARYRLYRATGDAPFTRIGPEAIEGNSFTDPEPPEGARYMIRALVRKTANAATFQTLSTGIMTN